MILRAPAEKRELPGAMSLHWLKTRWRTRGEYAHVARRLGWRLGMGIVVPLLVVAAILFGLFWMLSEPSRAGERAVRIAGLADSVVAAVRVGRVSRPETLEDLVAAGVLESADAEFLADQDVRLVPFGRASPDTATVFRRTGSGWERLYRKNGTLDYYTIAPSPDGRFVATVGPPRRTGREGRQDGGPSAGARQVAVRMAGDAGGSAFYSIDTPDHAGVGWSPDSRYLAVEARPTDAEQITSRTTFVLAIRPGAATRIDLPPSLRPRAMLLETDRAALLQHTSVRPLRWDGHRLRIEIFATGWIGAPGEAGARAVTLRCRVDAEVSQHAIREVGRRC